MDVEKTNRLTLSILEAANAYHRWVFENVRPWLGKGIFEVGCGIGNLTGFLLRAGKVVVSDINPDYLKRVSERFGTHPNLRGMVLWNIEQPPPMDVPLWVDTMVCSNVLEHVKDDEAVLSGFYRLLPSGGRVVLLVPALKVLYNNLDRRLGHFRRYTKRELSQKLERSGFWICSLRYFNLFGIFGWFFNGTLLGRSLLPARQVRAFDRFVPIWAEIERWVPPRIGQSLIAIGEKRERGDER